MPTVRHTSCSSCFGFVLTASQASPRRRASDYSLTDDVDARPWRHSAMRPRVAKRTRTSPRSPSVGAQPSRHSASYASQRLLSPTSVRPLFLRSASSQQRNLGIEPPQDDAQVLSPPASPPTQAVPEEPDTFLDFLCELLQSRHRSLRVYNQEQQQFYFYDAAALARLWSRRRRVGGSEAGVNVVYSLMGYYLRRNKVTRVKLRVGKRMRNVYQFVNRQWTQ